MFRSLVPGTFVFAALAMSACADPAPLGDADLQSARWWRQQADVAGASIEDPKLRDRFLSSLVHYEIALKDWDAALATVQKLSSPKGRISSYQIIAKAQAKAGRQTEGQATMALVDNILATEVKPAHFQDFELSNLVEAYFDVGAGERAISLVASLPQPSGKYHVRAGVRKVVYELAKAGKTEEALEFSQQQFGYEDANGRFFEMCRGYAAGKRFDEALRTAGRLPESHRGSVYSRVCDEIILAEDLRRAREVAAKIKGDLARGNVLGKIATIETKNQTVEDALEAMRASDSREEKLAIYAVVFDKLLEAKRFDEAENAIGAMVKIVADIPRPEATSAFGRSDDQIMSIALRAKKLPLARALYVAGEKERAQKLLQEAEQEIRAMPQDSPLGTSFLVIDVIATRAVLGMVEGSEEVIDSTIEPLRYLPGNVLASFYAKAGDVDRALQTLERYSDRSKSMHGGGTIQTLIGTKNLSGARRVLATLPVNEHTIYDYRAVGVKMIENNLAAELVALLPELPGGAPRAFAALGAAKTLRDQELKAVREREAAVGRVED
jgi:tetratricopeptide (TPR) repeat protein